MGQFYGEGRKLVWWSILARLSSMLIDANEASFKYNNEWDQCHSCMRHYVDIYVTSKLRSMSYPARRGRPLRVDVLVVVVLLLVYYRMLMMCDKN